MSVNNSHAGPLQGRFTSYAVSCTVLLNQSQNSIPHPFLILIRLVAVSYVSLQSALAHYGMIPELVPSTISVTTVHSTTFSTPFGQYDFRHIQVSWFQVYQRVELGNEQRAFIATPEKALLNLIYLQPGSEKGGYLLPLRLQPLDLLNMELIRAAKIIQHLIEEVKSGYTSL